MQDGWNALLYACDRGHLKFVELLLEKGARMDLCDEVWFTIQISSPRPKCEARWLTHCDSLLKFHHSQPLLVIKWIFQGGFTPLMQAADRNHPVVVKELLMRGADADRTNNVRKCS